MPRTAAQRRPELLNVRALVVALGGVEAVRATFDLTPQAIANWMAQNAIPKRYHAEMLQITERLGLYWRPPGWDPAVQLRYRPTPELAADRPLEPVA
jgi:hypothetical protein